MFSFSLDCCCLPIAERSVVVFVSDICVSLAKTAVFRHVLDKTMSADAGTRLFCCRKWKQIGASQRFSGSNYETVVEDIETEWSLGYFVERENDENETNKSLSTVFETLRTSSKSKSGFKSLSGKN